jgi:hypothetical protein
MRLKKDTYRELVVSWILSLIVVYIFPRPYQLWQQHIIE